MQRLSSCDPNGHWRRLLDQCGKLRNLCVLGKELVQRDGKGYCIASFKQVSDYYPVTKGKEKTVLDDGMLVLLPMKSKNYSSSPDKTNNPIVGIVFKEWKYGFGGVDVFFNEADLTLIY